MTMTPEEIIENATDHGQIDAFADECEGMCGR